MGNHMACLSPTALHRLQAATPSYHSAKSIKFLHCVTGAISGLGGPLTAAEAMLEFPAHFLCCLSHAALSGRRICAVPADQDLRATELYLLLPMHRLNSRFSAQEMAFLEVTQARSKGKKDTARGAVSQSKVAPLPASPTPVSAQISVVANDNISVPRSLSLRPLEDTKLQEEGSSSVYDMLGAAKHAPLCRSKSWMPKLETVLEHTVVC